MKNIIVAVILLLCISGICFPKANLSKATSVIDSPFDVYDSDISWSEQKFHLYSFVIALKENPEMIGIIIYASSEKYSLKKAKSRINRSVKYLTQDLPAELRVEKSRIVVIYEGKKDIARTTLQPINKKSIPADLKLPNN